MKFCLLQDREIVYTTNVQEWTDRMTTIDQTVAFDVVFRYTWVRTIFTGIEDDNGCSFETAIVLDKGEDGILRRRSQSYGEALCRHAVAVECLRSLRESLKKSLEEEAKTKIEIKTEGGIVDQVLQNGSLED